MHQSQAPNVREATYLVWSRPSGIQTVRASRFNGFSACLCQPLGLSAVDSLESQWQLPYRWICRGNPLPRHLGRLIALSIVIHSNPSAQICLEPCRSLKSLHECPRQVVANHYKRNCLRAAERTGSNAVSLANHLRGNEREETGAQQQSLQPGLCCVGECRCPSARLKAMP